MTRLRKTVLAVGRISLLTQKENKSNYFLFSTARRAHHKLRHSKESWIATQKQAVDMLQGLEHIFKTTCTVPGFLSPRTNELLWQLGAYIACQPSELLRRFARRIFENTVIVLCVHPSGRARPATMPLPLVIARKSLLADVQAFANPPAHGSQRAASGIHAPSCWTTPIRYSQHGARHTAHQTANIFPTLRIAQGIPDSTTAELANNAQDDAGASTLQAGGAQ